MNKKQKLKTKIFIISLSFIVCALFITAIIQTFVLKSKQSNLIKMQSQNEILSQQEQEAEDEYNYKNGQGYGDDYLEHEGEDENGNPYGNEGDKIIETNG